MKVFQFLTLQRVALSITYKQTYIDIIQFMGKHSNK